MPSTSACCINIYERVKTEAIIYDIPVYLTHTSLVEEAEDASFGQDPYRYIILKLSPIFTLTLLCGPSVDVNDLYYYITKVIKKDAIKELASPAMADCAIYYDVPDKILTWMFRSSHAMFSQSKAECTIRTGVEEYTFLVRRSKYSLIKKLSKELQEREKKKEEEEEAERRRKQNEWFRDLMRLYANFPVIQEAK
jgi:hypothetical protein